MADAAAARSEAAEDRRPNQESPELDLRAQIGLWLRVIDALLVAVEQTAFSLREVGSSTREAFQSLRDVFGRGAEGGRALTSELTNWRARMSRLTRAGFELGRIAAAYRLHTTKAAFLSARRAAQALAALHEDCAERCHV